MIKKISLLSLLSIALLSLSLACERANNPEQTTPPPLVLPGTGGEGASLQPVQPSVSVANLVLYPKGSEFVTLTVEIAKSMEERRKGLQGRDDLPDKHGMWFIFDEDVQDPFWMKDTPLPLDLVFVDKDFKVIDIFLNTVPNSELLLVPRQKYRYALEVKANSIPGFRLNVGDRVEFRLGAP